MKRVFAYLAAHVWACDAVRLESWAHGQESHAEIAAAGVSPMDRASSVLNGENPLVPTVVGTVATLDIVGVLLHNGPWWAKLDGDSTDYLDIRSALDDLANDPRITDVVLSIDSPGGSAVGLVDTVAAINRVRATGKTVTARVSGMAASAAYFLASAADRIIAEPDAMIGAIGTYSVLADTSAMMEQIGVKLITVSSGGVKGAGADGRVTEALQAETQKIVDALASKFRAQVATGRGLSADQIATLATGEIWLADTAVVLGLVDAVSSTAAAKLSENSASPITPSSEPRPDTDHQEPTMALDPKVLAAFASSHPEHSLLIIKESAKDNATLDSVTAAVSKAKASAAESEAASLRTKLAELESTLASERAAHAAALNAANGLGKIKSSAATDPGAGEVSEGPRATRAAYKKMTMAERGKFHRDGGVISEDG